MKNRWGPPTTVVIVFGTNMTTKTVLFNGVKVPIENSQDTNLIFQVPSIANGTYKVSVGGKSLGSFEVRYPDTVPTVSSIGKSDTSNWYSILGGGFYAGNTTMLVDGIEYDPYVMTPDECAVILPSEPTSFVLTTPHGTVTYDK